jgi:fumarate reductase flavoprotein subunit
VPKIVKAENQEGGRGTENKWSFEVPPPPIPAEDIKETFTTEVVVVGAGTSGKAAALSAAEAGAKVIQIDKHTTFRWGGGHIAAIGSRLQKKLGIGVDKDEVCLQLMKWAGNKPDQRFYRLWADHSGAVMDWLMDMTDAEGIETRMYQAPYPDWFDWKKEYYPEFPVCHWHSYNGSRVLNHSLALNCVERHALKLGVDIRCQTRAVRLVRKGKGRVTGVIARNPEGKYVQFNARKAVILCTGDYGNNPEMMQKYCPIAADVARENNIYMTRNEDLINALEPLNVGDGHRMAMWIGAVMEPGSEHAPVAHSTIGALGNSPHLRVNIEGERYENEDVPGQNIANALVRQPGKKVWQVCDSKWEEELPEQGVGLGKFIVVNDMVRARFKEFAVEADTVEELARKIKVPVGTFKATVNRYNELARMGKDLDYGKRPDRLTTIDKPPFYAGIVEQEFLVVLGGLNTNIKLQPLDANRKVIPGLYLAGNTVGNRFAVDYPTMCPGLTHGMAWTFGRLAGLAAAAEKV